MERFFGSGCFFFRDHFHKPIPKRFSLRASDDSCGYHLPMESEEVEELLIRKGLWETLNKQARCHPSSMSSYVLTMSGNLHLALR